MGKVKVLWVESEEAFADNIAKLMARKGLVIRIASEEQAALSALEEGDYDVMLLDGKLAAEGGWGILRRMKAINPRSECILLTTHRSSESAGFEPPIEVFDILHKPFRLDELIKKIKEACPQRHLPF